MLVCVLSGDFASTSCFPRLKLALGVLTSVEQLVPPGRPPACLEVPRGLGSSPVWMYGRLDLWTFRRMDV